MSFLLLNILIHLITALHPKGSSDHIDCHKSIHYNYQVPYLFNNFNFANFKNIFNFYFLYYLIREFISI